jgi:N-acetylglucosaminyldiphosphoundecaprenol N-acetyl-beta-D-mannosaminyltransferase
MADTYEKPPVAWVWGLPLARFTFEQTLDEVDRLIAAGAPHFVITANVHYAMLTESDPRLRAVNEQAALVVADGMPLVWASRWNGSPLPGRVTGADLFPALCQRAAQRGHRVFLLGAAPGVAVEAAAILCARYPGLQVVGIAVPPFRPLSEEENDELIATIRAARADLLFAAFNQPSGECWLAENCAAMEVPVSVQVGGSLNFITGRVNRAPRWVQRIGAEWLYRLWREPIRLCGRYARNLAFLARMVARDLASAVLPRSMVK